MAQLALTESRCDDAPGNPSLRRKATVAQSAGSTPSFTESALGRPALQPLDQRRGIAERRKATGVRAYIASPDALARVFQADTTATRRHSATSVNRPLTGGQPEAAKWSPNEPIPLPQMYRLTDIYH